MAGVCRQGYELCAKLKHRKEGSKTISNNLHLVKWARDAGLAGPCFRRYRIYDYKPGCVCYRFGHYPTRNPYYPTGPDWELLDKFCENGVEMLIVFEEWSDT